MKTDLTLDDYLAGAQHLSHSTPFAGFVYIAALNSGEYRIGMTKDLARRMKEHKASPICTFHVSNMALVEHLIHKKYKHRRRGNGECFMLSSTDLQEIKSIDLSAVADRPQGRPGTTPATTDKRATARIRASNGASTGKKKE